MNCTREGRSLPSHMVGSQHFFSLFFICFHLATAFKRYLYYVCCLFACSDLYIQTSSVLLNSTELNVPSSLNPDRLAELAHLLPSLGVTFLQRLTSSQLPAALPALDSVPFSPVQVENCTQPFLLVNSFLHMK